MHLFQVSILANSQMELAGRTNLQPILIMNSKYQPLTVRFYGWFGTKQQNCRRSVSHTTCTWSVVELVCYRQTLQNCKLLLIEILYNIFSNLSSFCIIYGESWCSESPKPKGEEVLRLSSSTLQRQSQPPFSRHMKYPLLRIETNI